MVHPVRGHRGTPDGVGAPLSEGDTLVQFLHVLARDPRTATIDVAFCVDTTSSMDDEVAALRSTLLSVVERIRAVQPYGRLRIGGVAYRDQGEAYVAQPFDFTDDPSEAQRTILRVDTAGGGDGPEAVNEALDVAVNRLSWTPDGALRVLFLIGDAGPHLERGRPYTETMRRAAEKGIKIVTVGCSGLDPTGEFVWRQLAAFTLGRFAFVSYGGTADVHVDAFPMNDLDDILARAVIREVEALHRGAAVLPAPAPQAGWQQQAPPPPLPWPPPPAQIPYWVAAATPRTSPRGDGRDERRDGSGLTDFVSVRGESPGGARGYGTDVPAPGAPPFVTRTRLASFVVLGCSILGGLAAAGEDPPAAAPTFAADVAPLVASHCATLPRQDVARGRPRPHHVRRRARRDRVAQGVASGRRSPLARRDAAEGRGAGAEGRARPGARVGRRTPCLRRRRRDPAIQGASRCGG